MLLAVIRKHAKEKTIHPEKAKHFHRTSIESAKMVIKSGRFLTRKKLRMLYPEMDLKWTANEDVMMSVDRMGADGSVKIRGLTEHGVGAVGSDVVFVFGHSARDAKGYDCLSPDPSAEEISIKDHCEAILVKDESQLERIKTILLESDLEISVHLQSEWAIMHYDENN